MAEAAAGAAIVGDGDDGGEVGDEGLGGRLGEQTGGRHAQLEATQEGGEAGSTADGDDAQARGGVDFAVLRLTGLICRLTGTSLTQGRYRGSFRVRGVAGTLSSASCFRELLRGRGVR